MVNRRYAPTGETNKMNVFPSLVRGMLCYLVVSCIVMVVTAGESGSWLSNCHEQYGSGSGEFCTYGAHGIQIPSTLTNASSHPYPYLATAVILSLIVGLLVVIIQLGNF
jgi:hypothetical protein